MLFDNSCKTDPNKLSEYEEIWFVYYSPILPDYLKKTQYETERKKFDSKRKQYATLTTANIRQNKMKEE